MRRAPALAALLLAALASGRADGEERRTAVVVGDHDGGEGTRPLRYAVTDAERIHRILTTIGGVAPEDAELLRDPSRSEVERALAEADRRAQGGVVFFYFSGHAKDGALRLGRDEIALVDLKARLAGLGARVKVAILDSCRSGELIRTKGGTVGPAFEVSAQLPGPRGLAVLASSAADEDSQESDLLGASFFTHFLASGLVGDADANEDGKVSLQEAYDYAYSRTVAQTAEARAGLQHPTYAYNLAGAGEVWLTDVARATATLVLPAAAEGSYVIVDAARRTLVAEIDKRAGSPRKVALAPSTYEVKRRDGDGALFARVRLADGDVVTLSDGSMSKVALARHMTKGADRAGDLANVRPTRWTVAATGGRQAFFAAPTRTGYFPLLTLVGAELDLRDRWESSASAIAFDFAMGSAPLEVKVGQVQLPTDVTQWMVGATYLRELSGGPLVPYVGARASLIALRRTFPGADGERFPAQALVTVAPGVVAGLNLELTSRLSLGLRARASFLLYKSDEDLSVGYADLGLLVRWEL